MLGGKDSRGRRALDQAIPASQEGVDFGQTGHRAGRSFLHRLTFDMYNLVRLSSSLTCILPIANRINGNTMAIMVNLRDMGAIFDPWN